MKYLNLSPFEINKSNDSIIHNNKIYDLISDADFNSLEYNVKEKVLLLTWEYPSTWFIEKSEWWKDKKYLETHNIKNKEKRYIKLRFDLVSFFEIKPRDSEIPYSEDVNLIEIAIIGNNTDGEDELIVFRFGSDLELFVKAETLTFDDRLIN